MAASEEQSFDLLESPLKGTSLIEAGAGTGKTYAIAGIFLRLLLEKRLSVSQILVVTYTVAATEELRDRIRKLILKAVQAFVGSGSGESCGEPFLDGILRRHANPAEAVRLLRAALRDFDEAPVFTIHGFCQRTLQENAFESLSPFDVELAGDETGLKEEIIRDFWRRHFYQAPPEFAAYALGQGWSPESCLKLAGQRAWNPDTRMVPDAGPVELASLPAFREALRRLKEAWPGAREEVLEKLNDPALNKARYKNAALLVAAMDAYAAGASSLPLFEGFGKFTTEELRKATNKNRSTPRHRFFEVCDDLWDQAARLAAESEGRLLFLKCEIFRTLRRELPERKRRLNIRSYDDLLTHLRGALEKEGGKALAGALRARYKAALIDEFQDTDPIQYAIFQTVFGDAGGALFLIGDPKQAIYSFRGADLFAYMRASKNVHSRYTLTTNRRSEPGLIAAVNAIFGKPENPFLYLDIPFTPAVPGEAGARPVLTFSGKPEPPLELWLIDEDRLDDTRAGTNKQAAREVIAVAVASEVAALIAAGREGKAWIGGKRLEEGDIAVLVRINEEARLIQEALKNLGVPGVLHSTGNLFDTAEALDMERLLAGIAEPGSEGLLRTALATDLLGLDGETLEALTRDERAWEDRLSRLREYNDLWERRGFIRMFRTFLLKEDVRARLLSLPDGERRLTNILHLSEVLHQAAVENKLGRAGLLKWLSRRRDPETPRNPEEHQLRLESDSRAVRIITIHKSKGLEYPVVFCPFNWGASGVRGQEFSYHDDADGWRLNLVLDSEAYPKQRAEADKEILAENIRLLYVALTRAKNRCYLVWGRLKSAGTSSLAYVLHPPPKASGVVKETEDHFANLSGAEMRRGLDDIAARSGGNIRISSLPAEGGKRLATVPEEQAEPVCRPFSAVVQKDWRIASFSHLLAQRGEPGAPADAVDVVPDLPDHDAGTGAEERIPDDGSAGIFAFPAGAKAGILIHDIFEHLDFTAGNGNAVEALVEEKLEAHGFAAQWRDVLGSMIRKVLAAPLAAGTSGPSLSRIGRQDRISELEFYFPLKPVTPEKLKAVFAGRQGGEVPADIPERIGSLNFQPCRGFMKGYMDLVFHYSGRFYLVDWKSNLLGNRIEDYGSKALAEAMTEHLYTLQYHLYVLALHQYLSLRVPGYDYGRHFGGVFYLFVRGVDPGRGGQYGIYRGRPEKALIDALAENLIEAAP